MVPSTGGHHDVELLVVEDDAAFRDLAVTNLTDRFPEAEIHTASDASAGLERLQQQPIDCVISDYDMPGRDGLEFLRAAREVRPRVAFILFTSKGSEEVASQAVSAGVTDYVRKGGSERYDLLANRVARAVERTRRERELAAMRSRFEALTDNTEVAVLTVDAAGIITYASEGVSDLFGYDASRLVDGPLDRIIPDRLTADHHAAFERYLATGERTLDWDWIELPAVDATGEEFTVGITFGETETHGEQLFTGVLRDISDRKTHQEELAHYRRLVEAAPDGIYATDAEGRFTFANPSLLELTGFEREELVGASASDVLAPESVARAEAVISELVAGEAEEHTVEMGLPAAPENATYEVTIAPLCHDGEFDGTVGVVRGT